MENNPVNTTFKNPAGPAGLEPATAVLETAVLPLKL